MSVNLVMGGLLMEQHHAAPTTHSPADQIVQGSGRLSQSRFDDPPFAPFGSEVEWNIEAAEKLDMDCSGGLVLGAVKEATAMDDPDAHDLVSHLFALITARLEDAATLAATAQSADLTQTSRQIADIRREIEDALSFIAAAEAIGRLQECPHPLDPV